MNDTAPDVSEYVRNRYAAMSPETRFLIGIRTSDLTEFERRRQICRRLYPSLVDQVFPRTF
jgi:hypothetical protein